MNVSESSSSQTDQRRRITVVVPCYNESEVVPHLATVLAGVYERLQVENDLLFLFVDDGSSDNTPELLELHFGQTPGTEILRHTVNRGIAAAILTGIAHAQTEAVCVIDADCTYNPMQLAQMIPMLQEGVDMVTASPYHAEGRVMNVPRWRIALSRVASRLYRLFMRNKLTCYTCCFRVYRKSQITNTKLLFNGFAGVTELLWKIDRSAGKVVECPAELDARKYGQSKMSFLRVAFSHLRLLMRVAWTRLLIPEATAMDRSSANAAATDISMKSQSAN